MIYDGKTIKFNKNIRSQFLIGSTKVMFTVEYQPWPSCAVIFYPIIHLATAKLRGHLLSIRPRPRFTNTHNYSIKIDFFMYMLISNV